MRRGFGAALLAALLGLAGLAQAQYLTYDAERRGQAITDARPSLRLGAMGGLRLVVPDENNELNLSDFGGNLAGLLGDRRGWSVEGWGGRNNSYVDRNAIYHGDAVRQRDRLDLEGGGLDVVYRREAERALGMTIFWHGFDARQRYGANTRVSGPDSRFFVNQAVGPLTFAVGASTASDKEDVVSEDIFNIAHTSKTRRLSVAAAWDLGRGGMSLGAQVDADRVRIEGRSADPSGFHGDTFEWRRPALSTRVSLTRPEGAGRFAFGVNAGRLSREGTEEASISWSDRFPRNPSRVNFALTIPSFSEEEKGWNTDGRLSYRLASGLRLGGECSYQKFESQVTESANSNFVGSRSEQDGEYTTWRLGGGIGTTLLRDGRLRAGLEGAVVGGKSDVTLPRQTLEQKTRGYEARIGGEYLFAREVAVRAGYQRLSMDYAVDEPASLGLSNGLTFGLGYLPRGGLVALDTYVRIWKETPDVPGETNRRAALRDLQASVRFLF